MIFIYVVDLKILLFYLLCFSLWINDLPSRTSALSCHYYHHRHHRYNLINVTIIITVIIINTILYVIISFMTAFSPFTIKTTTPMLPFLYHYHWPYSHTVLLSNVPSPTGKSSQTFVHHFIHYCENSN